MYYLVLIPASNATPHFLLLYLLDAETNVLGLMAH